MYFSHFDSEAVTQKETEKGVKKLKKYREHVQAVKAENNAAASEYSLAHAQQPALHDTIDTIRQRFKGVKHVVLVGIGGQNLGVAAVHEVLDNGKVSLHMLDTISAHNIELLLNKLTSVRSLKQLVVCISSKSGKTAEVLTNASVLFEALEKKFKKAIYKQTIFISDPGTEFSKAGKRLGATIVDMPKVVGGRYSVTTEAGLVPLALLGHDTDAFIAGVLDATTEEFESVVAENAARLQQYVQKGYRHYNFFAFEPRLATLGTWYRQLFAESIGKEKDRAGKAVKTGFVPTISTPTELHSVGQLYLSGFAGVYTDFVTFDDDSVDFIIAKKGIAKAYGGHTAAEVATAIYGGVMAAYQERNLPYRSTIFDESLPYSLGLFMGMRMLETMYVAELMNLNAFDQPNVELYKIKTREILGAVGMGDRKRIVVVDEQDNIIGAEDMLVAIEKGSIRRASRVYLFNKNGELLIQQRSEHVFMPLQFDQSAAGHVDEGETYHEAAVRELAEELGVVGIELEEVAASVYTPGFFSGIYRAVVSNDIDLNINSHEVKQVFWKSIPDLERDIQKNPEEYTIAFRQVWPLIRDKIIPS